MWPGVPRQQGDQIHRNMMNQQQYDQYQVTQQQHLYDTIKNELFLQHYTPSGIRYFETVEDFDSVYAQHERVFILFPKNGADRNGEIVDGVTYLHQTYNATVLVQTIALMAGSSAYRKNGRGHVTTTSISHRSVSNRRIPRQLLVGSTSITCGRLSGTSNRIRNPTGRLSASMVEHLLSSVFMTMAPVFRNVVCTNCTASITSVQSWTKPIDYGIMEHYLYTHQQPINLNYASMKGETINGSTSDDYTPLTNCTTAVQFCISLFSGLMLWTGVFG